MNCVMTPDMAANSALENSLGFLKASTTPPKTNAKPTAITNTASKNTKFTWSKFLLK